MSAFHRLRSLFSFTTPAVWVLVVLCASSALIVANRPAGRHEGMVLWLFGKSHQIAYLPVFEKWNAEQTSPARRIESLLIDNSALERRLLSGFMSGTPVADLVEVERTVAAKTFTGPLADIGFVDLTDRIRAEGLLDAINAPSFAPWTSRGRIFGLPHDVHPSLLAYRADITEAAGIDLGKVDTWADFFAALRPLMKDRDGDGRPDCYPLNFWPTNSDVFEALFLQADGTFFDAKEELALANDRNAFILTHLATWCAGPGRVVVDAPEFSAPGNALRLKGVVLASVMPDWLAGTWKMDLPELAGKVKLMPLPAWEKGGRRTSVQGGTMLGIPKTTRDFEAAWALAKRLYLNRDTHAKFFARASIIPPVKTSWDHPVFTAPDPFFCGQPSGSLYISQAPHVPMRTSSPYNAFARSNLLDILESLVARVDREQITDPAVLLPETRARLAIAHSRVLALINRNVFLRAESTAKQNSPKSGN